VGLILLQRL